MGTPKFMAPEYLTGGPMGPEPLDGRADIYALGLVLAYAAGGRDALPAVQLGEAEEMLRAVKARPDVRKLAPGLPEAVTQVIDRATAVSPSARYQTMEEFREALDGLLAQGAGRSDGGGGRGWRREHWGCRESCLRQGM